MEDRSMSRIPLIARSRLPLGLLGMIVLVATTELLLTRSRLDFSTNGSECWRRTGKMARQVRGAKIVCLGTSLVKTGVLPRLLEERTGKPAINLAVYSGPIPASYYLLRRALVAGARPSAVVIDCQNLAVPGRRREDQVADFLFHTRLWADLLDVRECLDLAWSTRDADFFVRTMLSWVLPSAKARFEIRAAVLSALRGQLDSPREVAKVLERNWAMNRGTHVFPHVDRPPVGPDDLGGAETVVGPETVAPDDHVLDTLTGQYARRLVGLAREYRITIFWLMPPLPPREQANRTRTGVDACLIRLARTLQVRAHKLIVIDGRQSGYQPPVFADQVHLDRQGAATFSDEVGAVVARYFKNPSAVAPWVTLPRYRDFTPHPSMIEDYSVSYLKLKAWGVVR
jgi:hypothetical protein